MGYHFDIPANAAPEPYRQVTGVFDLLQQKRLAAAQADAQPLQGQYPTSLWSPGETVEATIDIPVAAGEYQVFAELYQVETLARLPVVVSGEHQPDDRPSLGVVKVP